MIATVLITGASSGIGRSTAEKFLDKGWNVVATMRRPDESTGWPESDRLQLARLDVLDPASIDGAISGAIDRFGALDCVVNNAGYGAVGPFEAASPEQIERQFGTNVYGVFNVVRAVLPHMRERKTGTIVNVASVGGRIATPLYSLYHGTKWAVDGFSESLQYELEPFGIRVKIIEPGPIKTDFYSRSADVLQKEGLTAYDDLMTKAMPRIQRFGARAASPDCVANAIYKAATDNSRRLRYPANSAVLLAIRRIVPQWSFQAVLRFGLLR